MPTLKLILSDYWFDEIKSGRKTHEYRQVSLYWVNRLRKFVYSFQGNPFPLRGRSFVEFQRAYRKNPERMTFTINSIKELPDGIKTDLKSDLPVFDIELGDRLK